MFCERNVFQKLREFDIFFLDNTFEILFDVNIKRNVLNERR